MITPERKAQLDAMITQAKTSPTSASSGISPQRKAELDALIAKAKSVPRETPKKGGFVGELIKSTGIPSVAVSATNLGTSLLDLARGDQQAAASNIGKAREVPFLGKVEPITTGEENIGQFAKKTIGAGLQVGSTVVGGGATGSAVKTGLAGMVRQGVKQGAKAGAFSGASAGFGTGLVEDKTLGESAVQGIAGGAVGGALGGAIGGAIPAVGGAVSKAGSSLGKIAPKSENIMQRVARISKGKQEKFKQASGGESVGQYLTNRGIFGDVDEISNKLFTLFNQSKNTADESLASLKGEFRARPIQTALEDLFQRETRISTPGALSKDFSRVRELLNKYKAKGLNMTEINEVKRLYERNIKLDFLKQNLPESVAKATTLDNALRNWQFKQAEKLGLKTLPEINRETRLARQLLDDIGKEYAGSLGNNAVTLTDWIMLSGGDPNSAALFLLKKGISSKKIQSKLAEMLAPEVKVKPPKAVFGATKPGFAEFIQTTQPKRPLK